MLASSPAKRLSHGYVKLFSALLSERFLGVTELAEVAGTALATTRRNIFRLGAREVLERRELHPFPVYRVECPLASDEAREHVEDIHAAAEVYEPAIAREIREFLDNDERPTRGAR